MFLPYNTLLRCSQVVTPSRNDPDDLGLVWNPWSLFWLKKAQNRPNLFVLGTFHHSNTYTTHKSCVTTSVWRVWQEVYDCDRVWQRQCDRDVFFFQGVYRNFKSVGPKKRCFSSSAIYSIVTAFTRGFFNKKFYCRIFLFFGQKQHKMFIIFWVVCRTLILKRG